MKKKIAFIGNYYPKYRAHLFYGLSQEFNVVIYHDKTFNVDLELLKENDDYNIVNSKVWFKKIKLFFRRSSFQRMK